MFILMENDIAKAVAFYQELGLKLNFHSTNRWAEFDINGVKMGLAQTAQELPERRTGIVLEVLDVHQFYEHHKNNPSLLFLGEPVEAVHGIVLSFKDPGNNILDIYQPTPEKLKAAIKRAAQESEKGGCCQSEKDDKCCK